MVGIFYKQCVKIAYKSEKKFKGVTYFMKKTFIKTLTAIMAIIIVLSCVLAFTACINDSIQLTDTAVFVTVGTKYMSDLKDKTLKNYLDVLVEKELISYELEGTMIVTINGVTANYEKDKTSWMIYSNDNENTDATWGTYEYEGVTYASTTLGIVDLPIKDGCTYVFVITQF